MEYYNDSWLQLEPLSRSQRKIWTGEEGEGGGKADSVEGQVEYQCALPNI